MTALESEGDRIAVSSIPEKRRAAILAKLTRVGAGFLELLWPRVCPLCYELLDSMVQKRESRETESLFCAECLEELTRYATICTGCGRRCDLEKSERLCPSCANVVTSDDAPVCVGAYDGPLRELLLRLKLGHESWLSVPLSWLLVARIIECQRNGSLPEPIDIVIPVPSRRRRFGMPRANIAQFLAEHVARGLGVPAIKKALEFTRRVRPQKMLPIADRFWNVKGAMQCRENYRKRVEAATVLVVDDVLTTGATSKEAVRAVDEAGAARIVVGAVARTP